MTEICKRCNHKHVEGEPGGWCAAPCKKADHLCNCPRFVPREVAPLVRQDVRETRQPA